MRTYIPSVSDFPSHLSHHRAFFFKKLFIWMIILCLLHVANILPFHFVYGMYSYAEVLNFNIAKFKTFSFTFNTLSILSMTLIFGLTYIFPGASQVAIVVKNSPANAGDVRDVGSISGLGRSPAEGNGNPLQYSCLESPMDRGARWATVYEVSRSWTMTEVT